MDNRLCYRILAAIMLGCYPLFLLVGVSFRLPVWLPVALTAAAICAATVAHLQGTLLCRLEHRSRLLFLLTAIAAALLFGAASGALCALFFDTGAAVSCGALLTVAYLAAWRLRRLPLRQLSGAGTYTLLCTVQFLVLLYLAMYSEHSGESCLLSLLLMTLLFGSTRSSLAFQRAAPAGIHASAKRHNAVLYAVLSGITLLVICTGRYLAAAVRSGLTLVARAIGRFLVWLSHIGGESHDVPIDETQETTEVLQEQTAGDSILQWLLTGLLMLAIALLLWKLRHRLAAWLRSLFRRTVLLVRHLMGGAQAVPVPEQHPEFSDYVESITPAERTAVPRPDTRASWHRQYRRCRRLSDPTEQFRCGYGLWLSSLQLRRVEALPTDTPEEVCRKAQQLDDAALCRTVTDGYYLVRYACLPPEAEASRALRELLARTAKQLRHP